MKEILIEMTDEILDRTKKDLSGKYCQQVAYAFLLDNDGNTRKFPEKVFLYRANAAEAVAAGTYRLEPQSITVQRNNLTIGRLKLTPMKKSTPIAA